MKLKAHYCGFLERDAPTELETFALFVDFITLLYVSTIEDLYAYPESFPSSWGSP